MSGFHRVAVILAAIAMTSIVASTSLAEAPAVAAGKPVVVTAPPPPAGSVFSTAVIKSGATAPDSAGPRVVVVGDAMKPEFIGALRRTLAQYNADIIVLPAGGAPPTATMAPAPAPAPAPPPAPAPAAAPAPPMVTAAVPIALEGQLRYRYENRTVLDYRLPGKFGRASTQSLADRGDVSLMRTRFGATLKFATNVKGYFNFQDVRNMGVEGSPSAMIANVDLFNAYADVDSIGRKPLGLRVGRQVPTYGDGRLLSGADWGNAGRAFDAARMRWATKRVQADAFIAWINEGRTMGKDRLLMGLDVVRKFGAASELDGYHFERAYGDTGWTSERSARKKGGLFDATTGARVKLVRGSVELRLEGAVQRGRRADDCVKAWFGTGRLTADLHSAWKTKVFVEHLRASGDDAPTDGTFRRFDPINWGGHPYQGTLDIAGESNLSDWCGGLTTAPGKTVTLQAEFHDFRLMNAKDAWTDDSGNTLRWDTAGAHGTRIGDELDATVKWEPRARMTVFTGYSRFWRGDFVKGTGGGSNTDWGFTQLSISF